MRVVLDANVVASALIKPGGPPGQVIRAFSERRAFVLITTHSILAEIRRCVSYPRVRKYIDLSDPEIEEWLVSLAALAELVDPIAPVSFVAADPDDDRYLEAAVEGHADVIVTGDRHLLDLGAYEQIRILTVREFLDRLG